MSASAARDGADSERHAGSRVLVTGAAGFIGSHVCDRLLSEGCRVWGLDSFDDSYDPARKRKNLQGALAHTSMHLVVGDIRDQILLDGLMGDVTFDAVIHLAARTGVDPSIENSELTFDVNVGGTLRLLDAMQRHSIQVLLFGSSASVYGRDSDLPFTEDMAADRPVSPYAASKRAAEMLCHVHHHLFGLTAYCLRFFSVYGPRQRPDGTIHRLVRLMDAGDPLSLHGNRDSTRDYTYVTDVVGGVVLALERARRRNGSRAAYEIINLGRNRSVRLEELISSLADATGSEIPQLKWLSEKPEKDRASLANATRARELLGYEPSTDLEEGLREFVKWSRETTTPREHDPEVVSAPE